MTEVTLFNNVIEQLIDNLKKVHEHSDPTDKKEIFVMAEKIEYLKKFNSKKLFELFVTHVYSNPTYRENILLKNEDFFIEGKESNYGEEVSSKIFTLKGIWNKLSTTNKDTVWVYFQTLVKIVDKHIQKSVSADGVR